MARSRSSFELAGAIATAASLSEGEEKSRLFDGVALVSFGREASADPRHATPPPPPAADPGRTKGGAAATEESAPAGDAPDDGTQESAKRPPKLPDLSGVISPIVRCEKIVEWIAEATGALDVFLADGSGLPIAGAIVDAEARLASAGLVSSSIEQLAASLPGNASALFELHVGEGPFFQLVGFQAKSSLYLVGLTRPTPLTPRQAHAIRLACRHALGETLGGGG
jgi:hypothetical protein